MIFLTIISVFLVFSGQASLYRLKKQSSVYPKHFEVFLNSEKNNLGLIVINDVSVKGIKRKCRFLLDSGADMSVSLELAKQLGLEVAYTDSVTDGFFYTKVEYGFVDYEINGVQFNNVISEIQDSSLLVGLSCNIDGIIGVGLMKCCAWIFENGTIEITNSVNKSKTVSSGCYEQKLTMLLSGYPFVMAGYPGFRKHMLFDLGYNGLLMADLNSLSPWIIEHHFKKVNGFGIAAMSTFGNSNEPDTSKTILLKAPVFNFGEASLKHTKRKAEYCTKRNCKTLVVENLKDTLQFPVIYTEKSDYYPECLIGSEILDYYDIVIDFPRRNFYSRLKKRTYEYKGTWGVALLPKADGKYYTGVVWENSSAAKNGIHSGEQVVKINELVLDNIKNLPICEQEQMVRQELKKEDTLNLVLNIDGQEKSYFLKREDLFEN